MEISLSGLIDPSIQVPSLQLPTVEIPIDDWPNGLNLAFEIAYHVCWGLRGQSDYISIWVPAPGDLGDLESWLACPGAERINYIRRGHPSLPYEMFVPSSEPLSIDIGDIEPISWSGKCRVLAEQHAMLGETRESLFWLNVGVEALLKSRMVAAVEKAGSPINLDQLEGADAYWEEAKTVVESQNRELADEIEWPQSSQKPSQFRQIRFFCKNIDTGLDVKEVIANYSKVSRRRNALFHGETEEPILVNVVVAAREGFEWLDSYFCP